MVSHKSVPAEVTRAWADAIDDEAFVTSDRLGELGDDELLAQLTPQNPLWSQAFHLACSRDLDAAGAINSAAR